MSVFLSRLDLVMVSDDSLRTGPTGMIPLRKKLPVIFGLASFQARVVCCCLLLLTGGLLALIPPVWSLKRGPVEQVLWGGGSGRRLLRIGPGEPLWTPCQAISLHLIHAVLVAEDSRFFEHQGVDLWEIYASIRVN